MSEQEYRTADALWRAQTQRAVENFPISGTPVEPALVHAMGHVKAAAAVANGELGVLSAEQAEAIERAASAVAAGLAKGLATEEAVGQAKEFVTEAIRRSFPIGQGHGPLNHFYKLWK